MPGATVGPDAWVGSDCVLHPHVTVAEGCRIGDRVILHVGVVIGSDGFGYAGRGPRRIKVRQTGIVEVGNDVEIGANTTVDRATIGRTRIGAGTKIDNLVQIGHNVVIGERCLIIAQTGVAGSAVLGDDVILAGQAGVSDHVEIGDRSVIGPRSAILQSVPAGVDAFRHRRGRSSQAVAPSDALAAQTTGSVAAGFRARTKYPHSGVAGRQGGLVTA